MRRLVLVLVVLAHWRDVRAGWTRGRRGNVRVREMHARLVAHLAELEAINEARRRQFVAMYRGDGWIDHDGRVVR